MALTDEEKKELQSLEKDELIEMVGSLRETAATVKQKTKQEVIDKFLNGSKTAETEEVEEEPDVFDLEANKAFTRLKKKFNNR